MPTRPEPGDGFLDDHSIVVDPILRGHPDTRHTDEQARWRMLTHMLPQLVWTCDHLGHCDFVSNRWLQYTGQSLASQQGHGWLEQVHPEDRTELMTRWRGAVEAGGHFSMEFRLRRHDGVFRWFDTRAQAVRDDCGRVIGWVGSNTDIDEQKHAQAEVHRLNAALAERVGEQALKLRQRERDLQAILDHTPALMGYWDAQLRNRFANHAYRDWFDVDPAHLPGMHLRELLGESGYQANLPYIEGALRGEPQQFERTMATQRGSRVRHSQAHYIPDIDEHGRVQGFYVTVIDITPVKRAQAQADELRQFSEAVIEHSPVGMSVYAEDGSCVIANPALASLVGGTVERLLSGNFRQYHSWHSSGLLELAEATLKDGQPRHKDIETRSAFGKDVQAAIHLSRVDRDGRPHLLLIAQDVTGQRKAHAELVAARDAARDAAKTKSRFLANMSHEIRTPMNAIVGLSRLALEDSMPPKARDYLDKVHSSALALMDILDEVLDYSKIEAGQMKVESVPVDLHDLLKRVSALFSGRIQQKGLQLHTAIGQEVPAWIAGDPLRLAQVLNNLVGNAVKFTDEGCISVEIQSITGTHHGASVLKFSVRDTGVGIAQDAQAVLFDAFTQADSSITRRYGGSGLGLTICKSLVDMMGGHIGVNSTPGAGSEFWFVLPVQSTRPLHTVNQDALKALHQPTFALPQRRILLAEDNALNQTVAVDILQRMGLEVTVVDNGLQALDAVKAHGPKHFAAILMDLHMPVMDGLEAARRIHALPGADHLPIIAMTAAALTEDRAACMAAGMVDHIPKPIMPDKLFDALVRWAVDIDTSTTPPSLPTEGAAPAEKAASSASLTRMSMPGFDLPGMLERVMGNEALMWRLLAQFAEQEADASEHLARWMAEGDLAAARHKAHDLKGSAANMGAQAISEAAARLEEALRADRLDAAALAVLQQALTQGIDLIRARQASLGTPTGA